VAQLHAHSDTLLSKLRNLAQSPRPGDEPALAELEARARAINVAPAGSPKTLPYKMPLDEDTPLPANIGQYAILERIGRGGMGVVYRARQTAVNRLVALKMISAGAYAGPETRSRFRVEGEAIARLQHANVVQIYEFGEHDGLPYFSMELAEGGSLAARLESGPLEPHAAAQLVQTLALAMNYAHHRRVIHRDLKPSNVLLTGEGTPKITDFGLAKLLDAETGQTATHAVLGTPAYMAPEQAEGNHGVDAAADVYALGAILYAGLTGHPPFHASTRSKTLSLVRLAEPLPPSRLRPGLSSDLEAVCLKCLEKYPGRRYASAASLADDLGRWLAGEPTHARPRRWPARVWRSIRRHPVRALLVVALLAVAPVAYWLDPDRPLRNLSSRLGRAEQVDLIGKTGEPLWSKCINGKEKTKFALEPDGTFAIHSGTLCILELLPDPGHESYCYRAKV
jgi:serine/threonine-protein kinase